MPESALIVPVPAAEPLVGHLRAQFDPSARLGVPAHITALFPFMPPQAVSAAAVRTLASVIASVARFSFTLDEVRRFPETIYLAPRPEAAFLSLTNQLVQAFPEYPPYAGQHRDVVPHLTVARAGEPRLGALLAEVSASLSAGGGIAAVCSEVMLIENSSGRWECMHAFGLGAGRGDAVQSGA